LAYEGSYLYPPILAVAGDVSAPAAHTAATLTFPGAPGFQQILHKVDWSYSGSGTLAGGNLIVQDGSTTVFSQDITSQGAGFTKFDPPLAGSTGNALTVTLADGGANVSGKINVRHSVQRYFFNPLNPVLSVSNLDFSNPANSGWML
jgi:hypothetical protein